MPDIFGYIKKRRTENKNDTKNGIIWFRLCGFSGLIYNFFSSPRKCKFSKKEKKKSPIFPPLQLSTDMDRQTATLKNKINQTLWWGGDYFKKSNAHWITSEETAADETLDDVLLSPNLCQLETSQEALCFFLVHWVGLTGGGVRFAAVSASCDSVCIYSWTFRYEDWDVFHHFQMYIRKKKPSVKNYHNHHSYKSIYYK